MAQLSHSMSKLMRAAGMFRVAWLVTCLAGSLPVPGVALPVPAGQAAKPDESVISRLLPFQAPAALTSDPLSDVPVEPATSPDPQPAIDAPSGRTPTRAQPNRDSAPPRPRERLADDPATPRPLDASTNNPPLSQAGRDRHALSLSDLLPLDEADEAELRRAARALAESTSEAMPWLRPTLDALRGGIFAGETNQFFEGLSPQRAGWLGQTSVSGMAMPGTNSVSIAGPGLPPDMALATEPRQSDEIQRNIVRELISTARQIFDQPLAWLTIFLMMVGWFAVSATKRWFR